MNECQGSKNDRQARQARLAVAMVRKLWIQTYRSGDTSHEPRGTVWLARLHHALGLFRHDMEPVGRIGHDDELPFGAVSQLARQRTRHSCLRRTEDKAETDGSDSLPHVFLPTAEFCQMDRHESLPLRKPFWKRVTCLVDHLRLMTSPC